MSEAPDITKDTIRRHLISRANAFCKSRKATFSSIGEAAIKDSKFLSRVEAGGNFTVSTYQRVIDWLEQAEREHAA